MARPIAQTPKLSRKAAAELFRNMEQDLKNPVWTGEGA